MIFDVLKSWFCFITTYYDHPEAKDYSLNAPIWYNSKIQIANKYVFIKAWYKNGVKVIQDLIVFFFLGIDEFKCKYNLKDISLMQYDSVKKAIFGGKNMSNIDKRFYKKILIYIYYFVQNNYTP